MSLIVEDGTIVSGAESYCTVAFATAYHDARGSAAWAALATDTIREQLLRKATDFMVQLYRSRWHGDRVSALQTLDWPRVNVVVDDFGVDSDVVPLAIQNACASLALSASTDTLLTNKTQGIIREKIGPLDTEFDKASSQAKKYASVDYMLSAYLGGSANTVRLVRK